LDQLDVKVAVFEDGYAKEWLQWRIALDEVIWDIPVMEHPQQYFPVGGLNHKANLEKIFITTEGNGITMGNMEDLAT
jgi:hypothetical protein